jgi:hypothetical protein
MNMEIRRVERKSIKNVELVGVVEEKKRWIG